MSCEPSASLDTRLLDGESAAAIERAADLLRQGMIVAFPTDTVYGVGVHPFDEAAIRCLYAVKERPTDKGIPILLADTAALADVCGPIPESARQLMARYWPGPLTVIVPRHPSLPAIISPNDTIAVRIPDNAVARNLIRAAGGALATSSANLSGQPSATSGEQAKVYLDGRIAAVVDGGPSPGDRPSTIVDCTGPILRILREGPISAAELGISAAEDVTPAR